MSSHRLPTVTASQALQDLRKHSPRAIVTGISELDSLLGGSSSMILGRGGLIPGHLIEVIGPPGVGKTAFGLQVAVSALRNEGHVVWLDTASPLAYPRLTALLREANVDESVLSTAFHRYCTPTMTHLLALVLHPKPEFPPKGTSVLVVDTVSTLFPLPPVKSSGTRPSSSQPLKRPNVTLHTTLANALARIASIHKLAVVVSSQTHTRIRSPGSALLVPSISNKDWEAAFSARICLFRDFPQPGRINSNSQGGINTDLWRRLRYAGVLKAPGVSSVDEGIFTAVIPFSLSESTGNFVPVDTELSKHSVPVASPVRPKKRKFDEVPDSEDEWDGEIECLDGDWEELDHLINNGPKQQRLSEGDKPGDLLDEG